MEKNKRCWIKPAKTRREWQNRMYGLLGAILFIYAIFFFCSTLSEKFDYSEGVPTGYTTEAYYIHSGETLSSIAVELKNTYKELTDCESDKIRFTICQLNHMPMDNGHIEEGQIILVPVYK